MLYRIGADAVLLLHLSFILFVLFGGLLVAWRRGFAAASSGRSLGHLYRTERRRRPLTYWENLLRRVAGNEGYEAGFIEHYLLPLIYPDWLSTPVQYVLAAVVVLTNLLTYGWLLWRLRHR